MEWRGEGAAAAQGEARLLVDGQRNATHAYGKSPLELQWDLAGLAGHDLADEERAEGVDGFLRGGAARLAGEMQITEAGPSLANLLAHTDPAVRLAAVEAALP